MEWAQAARFLMHEGQAGTINLNVTDVVFQDNRAIGGSGSSSAGIGGGR